MQHGASQVFLDQSLRHPAAQVHQPAQLLQASCAAGNGPAVQAAALRAWSLLLTTAPSGLLDSAFLEGSLGQLSKCLHSSSVDVRSAGGEAAALLYHSSGLAALDGDAAGLHCKLSLDTFQPSRV